MDKRATVVVVSLPHGFISDGSWVRTATLRELNGYDEQILGDLDGSTPPSMRTTDILNRIATVGLPSDSTISRETIRRLTVGDRVAMLLQLRALIFGDKMDCLITCPSCAEEMSLELSVRELLLQPSRPDPSACDDQVSVEGRVLRVRAVTGADLEAIVPGQDQARLAEMLVRSCVVSSDAPLPSVLSDAMIAAVSSKLEQLDPQADIVIDLSCPACRARFKTPFVIEDFVVRELGSRASQLENEVHWIAFNYHWSEDEILSLPLRKRKRYIDLINRTLSGEAV